MKAMKLNQPVANYLHYKDDKGNRHRISTV
jgi:hypothetical protein